MQEPQSNLEKKGNPTILKKDFSLRTDPFIFTSIAPVFLDQPNKTGTEINKPHPSHKPYQTEVQKPILIVATDQTPDHT